MYAATEGPVGALSWEALSQAKFLRLRRRERRLFARFGLEIYTAKIGKLK